MKLFDKAVEVLRSFGTQTTTIDEEGLAKIDRLREQGAEEVAAKQRIVEAEARLRQEQQDRMDYNGSLVGGTGTFGDSNSRLTGFMRSIFGNRIGGGETSGDVGKRNVAQKAEDSDAINARSKYQSEHASWFKPRPKPTPGTATNNALKLPGHSGIKSKLPQKK